MGDTKGRKRLFKVAKELNLSHTTIEEFLAKKGYKVTGPNTAITPEMYEEILKRFSLEKQKAEKLARRRREREEERKIEKQEKLEKVEKTEKRVEAKPVAEPEKVEVQPAEVAETVEETAPAAESQEAVVSEPTEGTGTVEEKTVVEETTQEAPATEVEKEEKPAEEPAAAEAAEEVAEEKVADSIEPAQPKVGDIIDHPLAKKFLEEQERRKKEKAKRKKEILKRIKEEAKKEKKAPKEEEEVVPRRIQALEKEEPEIGGIPGESVAEKEERAKKKKEKKKKRRDEELSEKERRRRKALEMIRKEGKKSKLRISPTAVLGEEEVPIKEERRKRSRKKKEVDQQEVEDTVKKTLASISDTGKGKKKRKKVKETGEEVAEEDNVIHVTEFITVQDLANLMDVPATEVIKKCLELGQMVTINQRLEMDLIKLLAEDFGFKVEEEEEFASEHLEEYLEEEEDSPEDYQPRHPVVTIMGHVDHGKTSLLDYIRKTNVVAGEAGGITQHIGAYVVELDDGRKITFLDTPGHEAFTAMRARGAQVTDIVVLVVAADDRVMPQTIEAIDHARAAGVPMVIAINKVDKPNADPMAIRKQLADQNVLVEDWGGSYQVVEVSAKTGQGVDELLEKILLEAELLELKANPNKRARGVVIESRLDKGKGPVATVLIQQGTLKVGDVFIVGQHFGRVRALLNERNQRMESAGPAYPIQVLGIDGVPEAGDKLIVLPDEKLAREIANRRQQLKREQDFRQIRKMTLDDISRRIQEGEVKELNILIKADVDGSAQALSDALLKLSTKDVTVHVVRRAVGPITESDIMLAAASHAIIIGFHVRPTLKAKELAEQENVDIRLYKVIYDAIEDVKKALEGLLEPVEREKVLGLAEVREVFKISRVGTVAGCYVLDGKITRNARVRLIRNDVEIYEGKLASLKRFKDDVREVSAGYECGMMIENYNDIKVGDQIEAFEVVKERRTLEAE